MIPAVMDRTDKQEERSAQELGAKTFVGAGSVFKSPVGLEVFSIGRAVVGGNVTGSSKLQSIGSQSSSNTQLKIKG